ncbi:hypothetical protein [Polaromonas sp.]|uniref:hypothetical protein n=1 Tax=Polaromonas sp. TaxID=1869339 RepID=UPI00356790F8
MATQLPIPECFDKVEDALKAAVMAMGGFKAVGRLMRPDFDNAAEWLRKCLSDDRRERLDPSQVMWILREAKQQGFHAAMDFIAGDVGYKAAPVDAEAQIQSLQETIAAGLLQLNQQMARVAHLQERKAQ